MGHIRQAWGFRAIMRLFMVMALGSLSLSALPAHAQEMECDTDPLIFVDAGDGRMFILHQWFKAPLRLPNGEVVSHADMKRHLETESTYRVKSISRAVDAYTIVIESMMQPYRGEIDFTYKTWLTDDATKLTNSQVTGRTGQWLTSVIRISVDKIERTERPKKNGANEVICNGVVTGLQPDVRVPAGATCQLQAAIVNGNVTVEAGGKLRAYKTQVDGDINAKDAAWVQLNYPNGNPMTAVEVTGDIKIEKSRPTTTEPNAICDRTVIGEDLKISSGRGEFFIGDFGKCKSGNVINGDVTVKSNQGAIRLADNNIAGNLSCERNTVVPSSAGLPNHVDGSRYGQCQSLQ